MGTKVNALSFRLKVFKHWEYSQWFLESTNKKYSKYLYEDLKIREYFISIFEKKFNSLINKCLITRSYFKVYIYLYFFSLPIKDKRKKNKKLNKDKLINNFSKKQKLNILDNKINKLFIKKKELQNKNIKTDKKINPDFFTFVFNNKLNSFNIKIRNKNFYKQKLKQLKLNKRKLYLNIHKQKLSNKHFKVVKKKYTKLKIYNKNINVEQQLLKTLRNITGNTVVLYLFNTFYFIKKPKNTIRKLKKMQYKTKLFQNNLINLINFYFSLKLIFQFKDASSLASFIAYELEKVPKHLKKIYQIEYVLKLLKIKNYKDILGIKIRIKGCLNNSDRSRKHVIIFGRLPLQTLKNYIDYGFKNSFTNFGTFGTKVWIAYK